MGFNDLFRGAGEQEVVSEEETEKRGSILHTDFVPHSHNEYTVSIGKALFLYVVYVCSEGAGLGP